MKFNKYDLAQLENIMRALKSGSFTMQGMEILAFADCMKWASKLHELMGNQIKAEEAPQTVVTEGSPFKEDSIKKAPTKVKKN